MVLTKIPDLDFNILMILDDVSLENGNEIDCYSHQLCQNKYLWYLKIKNLYPTFPSLNLDWFVLKKLYYKLKYQNWTSIIVWADQTLLNWITDQSDYIKFFKNYVFQSLRLIILSEDESIIVATQLFNFIYNHRFILDISPDFKKSVKEKLIAFSTNPFFSESAKIYYKNIFGA